MIYTHDKHVNILASLSESKKSLRNFLFTISQSMHGGVYATYFLTRIHPIY